MATIKSLGNGQWYYKRGDEQEWIIGYQPADPDGAVKVYALADPRDGKFRYIGQSGNPEARVTQHRHGGNRRLRLLAWLDELDDAKLEPVLTILEETIYEHALARERYWIKFHKAAGADLFNIVHVLKPTYR